MKTEKLFESRLGERQQRNSRLNHRECVKGKEILASYPRRIVFELTNRCNFQCIQCMRGVLNFEHFDLPVHVIKRFEPVFPFAEEVTLHGWGESTLHPDFIEVLKCLAKYPLLRKYFVTNGSRLAALIPALLRYRVGLLALSLDGPTFSVNDSIRRGGSFMDQINSLRQLIDEKKKRNLAHPYINIVFTAMHRNIRTLPDMIIMANEIGIPEVKVVYLTVFDERLIEESLMGKQDLVEPIFRETRKLAKKFNIKLKLPDIQGRDRSGLLRHKPCAFAWRDLFIGCDGFVRPCQSTTERLIRVSDCSDFQEIWNSEKMQRLRLSVNREDLMSSSCYYCYHSSCANWNLPHSFIQTDHVSAPAWGS